jgi:hypothetical protein
MQHRRFLAASALVLLASCSALYAQQTPPAATQPTAGGNWERVKKLPALTKVHLTTEHGGKTCRIFAVTDDTLTCAKGGNSAGAVLQRTEIKRIKLTHYGRSTLVGAGIGGGIGAVAGAIGGRSKPCPTGQTFCLNGLGIGAGGVAAIFGVAGAVAGSVVGGTTDLARGSSIYTRP